jgi:AmmeMemoRadiSam system protein B
MEDYCHSFEHTIELQMIFLQHLMGANVKVLPILCGSIRAEHLSRRQARR